MRKERQKPKRPGEKTTRSPERPTRSSERPTRSPERPTRSPERPTRSDGFSKQAAPILVTPAELGKMLRRYGIELPGAKLTLLAKFHEMLVERNRVLNITRIWNLDDIVLKHYVDCFLVARLEPDLGSPILDLGTGGGFPGIPLKILRPELHMILGEGVRKRVDFLRDVRSELALEKVDLIGRNIDNDFVYPVKTVITRAVEAIRETLGRVRACTSPGSHVIFMKGPNVDPEKEMAQKKWGNLFEEVRDHAYQLPDSPYQRRLVVYRRRETGVVSQADGDET